MAPQDAATILVVVALGTSAACPMFSALWVIAVQKAGRKLGQPALPPGIGTLQ